MAIKYFSDERISDMLNHGFKLEPIIGPTIKEGHVAALYANPENYDPILMDVFKTIEEVREFDRRREEVRKEFSDKFGVIFKKNKTT